MKKFFGEFKTFITRGNVVDLAVGVIIGGAFTAIVNGLSNYVLKPLINWVICMIVGKDGLAGAVTFLEKAWMLDDTNTWVPDLANSIYIDWGALISTIINFILTALVLFIIVKFINNAREGAKDGLTKEDRIELKKRGIKKSDTQAVQAYLVEKAEAEAKAKEEAEEAARLERLANPTTEDLLKMILEEMKQDNKITISKE